MLRLVYVAALTPLAAGTGVFLAWWITRDDAWARVGVWTLLAGAGSVALGLGMLALAWWRARRRGGLGRGRALTALALLLVNVPAAFTYALLAAWERSTFEIVVVNRTDAPLHEVEVAYEAEIVSMDVRRSFPVLAPGGERTVRLRIPREGAIEVRYLSPGGSRTVEAIPYALPTLGERVEVRLLPGGDAEIVSLDVDRYRLTRR